MQLIDYRYAPPIYVVQYSYVTNADFRNVVISCMSWCNNTGIKSGSRGQISHFENRRHSGQWALSRNATTDRQTYNASIENEILNMDDISRLNDIIGEDDTSGIHLFLIWLFIEFCNLLEWITYWELYPKRNIILRGTWHLRIEWKTIIQEISYRSTHH